MDPFDGAVDLAARWTSAGTQVPTQSNGQVVLAPTVGASVSNNSVLISQPAFVSPGLGFLAFACTTTLEAAQVASVNVNRFWGRGQVTSFAYATPVTDGIGFEVEGTAGALQCVVWVGGTKYVVNSTNAALVSSSIAGAGGSGTALPANAVGTNYGALLTWKPGLHRYAVFSRNDIIYWFVEGTEVPVAALSYVAPNVQTLPVRFASITNGVATSLANTFTAGGVAVCDSTAGSEQISDGTYPWRKAQVGVSGAQAVMGANPPTQTFAVTAATPVTGAGLSVAEAASVTFIVKNTVAGTGFTGVPVIVFEQSDDNTSWAPLAVTAPSGAVSAQPPITAGSANVEQMFDCSVEGVNWVRARVVTAQTANGMTVVIQPDGMPSSTSTSAVAPAPAAGAMTSVAAAVTSTTVLAANANRKGAVVFNDSSANLYLALSASAASVTAYTVKVSPATLYEVPWPVYTGQLTGIWDAAVGSARVTELT
jgi:hypothetical protein